MGAASRSCAAAEASCWLELQTQRRHAGAPHLFGARHHITDGEARGLLIHLAARAGVVRQRAALL